MPAAETGLIRQPHGRQHLSDGALARCQDGAPDQHQDMIPDRRREARLETANHDTRIVGTVVAAVESSHPHRARGPAASGRIGCIAQENIFWVMT
jgi:hypothetical protein